MKKKVSEHLIKFLELENIDTVFGYPGAATMPLYEALRNSDINHILVRNEQSAGHMASGYARAKDTVGVCIVTSGPGATNLITGIATAYMDSIPLVIITGQVDSKSIGTDMFQEADIVGSTEPFTKHNFLVKKAEDLPKFVKEAFYLANTGRKGPVLIDLPVDIQKELIDLDYPETVDIRGYKPTYEGNIRQIKKAVKLINSSKSPLVCIGGGIASSNSRDELEEFIEKTKIPVACSLMGVDSFDNSSKYFAGLLGSHGYPYVNRALNKADLLVVIGARLADRTTSRYSFNENQSIIHIDIDPAEIGKTIKTHIPIVGDAKNVLESLNTYDFNPDWENWSDKIFQERQDYFKKALNLNININKTNPCLVVKEISDLLKDKSILTADVGQNQIWATHFYNASKSRKFFTSGGLGTMGYSLPAAIGSKIANPDSTVVAMTGEGGIQMLIGELAVLREHNLDLKVVVFNNASLGMVREMQEKIYGDECHFSTAIKFNPDFMKLTEAYDIRGVQITNNEEIKSKIKEAFSKKGPCIIECKVDPNFPTLPTKIKKLEKNINKSA
jgi:acetolactate synthase-1/2/3 large subunit